MQALTDTRWSSFSPDASVAEVASQAPTLPAPPLDLPLQCTCCGAVLLPEEWERLKYIGLQDDFDGGWLELRNHRCGSTLAAARRR